MIKYYLKTAFRNLARNKFYTTINIAGLSIGMAVAILIYSYVWYEYSFDRFHTKSNQIYRVVQSVKLPDRSLKKTYTGGVLASALKVEIPEILHVSRLNLIWEEAEVSCNGKEYIAERGDLILADNDIFKIFDIEIIQGDIDLALEDPNSIIITEDEAFKFFGNENPIGKFINIRHISQGKIDIELNLKVTGVVKSMPDNSHFSFKYIIPQNSYPKSYTDKFTRKQGVLTYLTLPANYDPKRLDTKLEELVKKYFFPEIEGIVKMSYNQWIASGGFWKLKLQPLKDIYLANQYGYEYPIIKKGNRFNVHIYSVIAFFIILLSCINYITLTTARLGIRAKEVGVRKVNGANKNQLIGQFLLESIILSSIAFVVAIGMIKVFYEPFNKLLGIESAHDHFGIVTMLICFLAFILIIGVLIGSYPAFLLARYKTIVVIKGQPMEKVSGKTFRNFLVVFQFLVSIILIISSISVYKQFNYMQNKELGFDNENIVIVNIWKLGEQNKKRALRKKWLNRSETFLQEVLKHPNIINASITANRPGRGLGYALRYVRKKGATIDSKKSISCTVVDQDYFSVFGLEIVAGNNFRKDKSLVQPAESVIINEKAASHLGLEDPVGKYIYQEDFHTYLNDAGEEKWKWGEFQFKVIGVVKDFHNRGLQSDIKPAIFFPINKTNYYLNYVAVKFAPEGFSGNINMLEEIWDKMETNHPFEYTYFDKEIKTWYDKEKKLAHIFTFFTILAIMIASLGIYGLATLSASKRKKEIGIRKVNGATIFEIMSLLNKDFTKLVAMAFVIACPIAYYGINKWLENFAYKTTLSWWVFALAGGITMVIALLTVSWESYKAASRNPVEALRDE